VMGERPPDWRACDERSQSVGGVKGHGGEPHRRGKRLTLDKSKPGKRNADIRRGVPQKGAVLGHLLERAPKKEVRASERLRTNKK